MESLRGYDNWKLDDGSSDCAMCDYCREDFDIDDLVDYCGVYICRDCLQMVEPEEEEEN